MTISELRQKGLIILECISGSKAYGLDTAISDTDIKGVFILPPEDFLGLDYVAQVNNETNDIVFYELGRFMELLMVNNPNILELLNTPNEAIIYKHPLLASLTTDMILSKLCKDTFGKFALSQIKKAKGLKKKIMNPVSENRKNILSFCYVNYEQGAIPLEEYLVLKGWKQEDCGLVDIPHMKDILGLYHSSEGIFNGIMRHENSNEICLSSIPKGLTQSALLYFNKEGYSVYCKEYKEYWEWVANRNESRYQNTLHHGKNYDAKNMMHVFRLLDMACEIGNEGKINVKRPNREFLLSIKSGKYSYEELLEWANDKQNQMEEAFANSHLPAMPDRKQIHHFTYQLRAAFYTEMKKTSCPYFP